MPKVTKLDVYAVEDRGITKYVFATSARAALEVCQRVHPPTASDARPWWKKLLELFP